MFGDKIFYFNFIKLSKRRKRNRKGKKQYKQRNILKEKLGNRYDDFFKEEIQKEIWEKMMRPKWSFTGGGKINRFWHMDGLEKEKYFSEYLYKIICKKLGVI